MTPPEKILFELMNGRPDEEIPSFSRCPERIAVGTEKVKKISRHHFQEVKKKCWSQNGNQKRPA
jgi:hypothetical protein